MTARRRFLRGTVGFLLVLVAWSLLVKIELFHPRLLPSPVAVGIEILRQLGTVGFWLDLGVSVWRVIAGFLLAVALSIPAAVLMERNSKFADFYSPINNFIRYLPVAAMVPLLMLWFGISDFQKMTIIFVGTYFQLTLMLRDNLSEVSPGLLETAEVLGARSPRQQVLYVVLPSRLPFIFDDLKVGLGWAWSYLLVAEIIAAQNGIGFKIMQTNRFLQTPRLIAFIIVVGFVGIGFDLGFERLNKTLFRWRYIEEVRS